MRTFIFISKTPTGIEEVHVKADDVSDGYHTMHELYQHRMVLNIALFRIYDNYITPLRTRVKCWKSKFHFDGTMFDGYFIVGMTIHQFNGVSKYVSYHYQLKHWDKFNCIEVPHAPEYEPGPNWDTIQNLMEL